MHLIGYPINTLSGRSESLGTSPPAYQGVSDRRGCGRSRVDANPSSLEAVCPRFARGKPHPPQLEVRRRALGFGSESRAVPSRASFDSGSPRRSRGPGERRETPTPHDVGAVRSRGSNLHPPRTPHHQLAADFEVGEVYFFRLPRLVRTRRKSLNNSAMKRSLRHHRPACKFAMLLMEQSRARVP